MVDNTAPSPDQSSPSRTRASFNDPDGGEPPRHTVVGRPANACLRCRRRKVKCSCEHPTCQPCVKANVTCEYPTKRPAVPNWQYVSRLEARLRDLDSRPPSASSTSPVATSQQPHLQSFAESPTSGLATVFRNYSASRTEHEQRITAAHARMAPPSSAQLFNRLPSVADLDAIRLDAHVEEDQEFIPAAVDASLLPRKEDLDQAIDYFSSHVNSAFPILHEPTLRQKAESLCVAHEQCSQMDVFTAFSIMAIWCASRARMRSPGPDWFQRAHRNGEAAKSCLTPSNLRPSLVKLQCQHLWLQYVLRNPEAGDIWALTGDLVRSTFDLGLHLDAEGSSRDTHKPLELDMRRRLFWATYCLDQKVAVALGRPPGIVSDWISARFPSLAEDDMIGISPSPANPPCHRKESVIHHIRLRILQADIYQRLFTVAASRSAPPPSEWFIMMGNKLDEWRTSYHSEPGELLEPSWLDLHYNLSRQLLYRPNPGNSNPDQQSLRRALDASSYLMRRYKAMWRQRTINFVWLAIHHVFVSGVTYLNSIWIAAKNGWTIVPSLVEAMLDIQACSQVLEGMTETQHGTAHMRDAFEVVSAAVIRHLSHRPPPMLNNSDIHNSNLTLDLDSVTTSHPNSVPSQKMQPPTYLNANGIGNGITSSNDNNDLTSGLDQLLGAADMSSFPWSTWAIDPSRPPSPVPHETMANLDAFFFNPFVAAPPSDIMSMPTGTGTGDTDNLFGPLGS